MPNDGLNENYNVITAWCKNVKSFWFSWAKSLIGCIISITIRPHSHTYKCIMILLRLTSTYDFDMIWYRLTLYWYDMILGSFRLSFPLPSHQITCRSHQVYYNPIDYNYYGFKFIFMDSIINKSFNLSKVYFGHGWIYHNLMNSPTHVSLWRHTIPRIEP